MSTLLVLIFFNYEVLDLKTVIKLLFTLIIIVTASVSTLFFYFNTPPVNMPMEDYEFQISEGMSAGALAYSLQENNLIKSSFFFRILTRLSKLDKSLKVGYIKIESGMKTTEIITAILKSDFVRVSITIPEGYTTKEINKLLIERKLVTEDDIKNFFSRSNHLSIIGLENYPSTEGFLFPETYVFHKGVKLDRIYSAMVRQFFIRLDSAYPDWRKLSSTEVYNGVILASIIEKEVRDRTESEIVSGIFHNRLNKNMRLQSCATVQFILDKPKDRLLFSDLTVKSPYNTYLNTGLPPGPISNPGFTALKAAFNPAKTDYLYFVVKDPFRGTHHFSRTYDEHLKAQERYIRIQGFQ